MLDLVESFELSSQAATSQTSVAYARIKTDILAGRLAPGERLKSTDLALALDVSPGAIREALSRLVPEQLVVSRNQKGFIVAPISIEDLMDITDLRCEIESVALRRSVARGDAGWEAGILAAAHQLRRTPGRTSEVDRSIAPQWVDRHAEFHFALVAACGSRRLLALHSQLYEQSERYRGLSAHSDTVRHVETEHQALVEAALDRNADLLVGLSVAHFRKTTSLIVEAARRQKAADAA